MLFSDAAYSLPSSLNNSYMHKHHANRPPPFFSQGTVVSHFQRSMPQWALRSPVPRSTCPLCPSLPASWRWRDSQLHRTASTCHTAGVSTRSCSCRECVLEIKGIRCLKKQPMHNNYIFCSLSILCMCVGSASGV